MQFRLGMISLVYNLICWYGLDLEVWEAKLWKQSYVWILALPAANYVSR